MNCSRSEAVRANAEERTAYGEWVAASNDPDSTFGQRSELYGRWRAARRRVACPTCGAMPRRDPLEALERSDGWTA